MYRILRAREHPRLGCISEDSNMPGLYERIGDRINQWTETNYTRPGRTMEFWGLLCSIWVSKNDYCGCRCFFAGNFKKNSEYTLLIPVNAFARVDHNAIKNEGFHRYLNKVHKIKSSDKGSFKNGYKAYCLHCMLGMQDQYTELTFINN